MKLTSSGPLLSAIFVDYDDVYFSLKRKSEEAAKRFASDSGLWLKEIESGRLITPTNPAVADADRRLAMNRCYGNPVPRRNTHDSATDVNSFPFVRHHFLRAGFQTIDCAPNTPQLKNSAAIPIVMDIRDYLEHETRFGEFIILSNDADFTPVLHRLRAHARRIVILASDDGTTPYTAVSDGRVREQDLIALLLDGRLPAASPAFSHPVPAKATPQEETRKLIVAEVVATVRAAAQPLPVEALSERVTRVLGHEKTAGTSWGGTGGLRDLLMQELRDPMRLSDQAPFIVFEAPPRAIGTETGGLSEGRLERVSNLPVAAHGVAGRAGTAPGLEAIPAASPTRSAPRPGSAEFQDQPGAARPEGTTALQQSIARIHNACKAPPLSPPEYRTLFELAAQEIAANGPNGPQTVVNIAQRAHHSGIEFRRDDIRFVIDVVSEPDPFFDQGASPNIFAGRFRNFVVARCRGRGLNLSPEELELIEAWFAGPAGMRRGSQAEPRPAQPQPLEQSAQAGPSAADADQRSGRWWISDDARGDGGSAGRARYDTTGEGEEEFPRIVRRGIRG